jgi:NAD(P)-dependent dehydrogenase (short-subunit alcohol dehydrogenase family)
MKLDGKHALVTGGSRGIGRGIVLDDCVLNGLPDAVVQTARSWHASGWTPMGRMGTPAGIGNVVALLCTSEAGWITGQLLHADGGASLVDTHLPLEIQRG